MPRYAVALTRKSLLRNGFSCWIGDLNWVINHLPGGTKLDTHVENMDTSQLQSLLKDLERRCNSHLNDTLLNSAKCSLLTGRIDIDGGRGRLPVNRRMTSGKFKIYLNLLNVYLPYLLPIK